MKDYEEVTDIDFVHFTQTIPLNGYYWDYDFDPSYEPKSIYPPDFFSTVGEIPPPFLMPVKSKWQRISPLEINEEHQEPLLYAFGNLDGGEQQFLQFATKYGSLLGRLYFTNLDYWRKELFEVKAALVLLKLIRTAESTKLPSTDRQQAVKTLGKLIIRHDVIYEGKPLEHISFAIPSDLSNIKADSYYSVPANLIKEAGGYLSIRDQLSMYSCSRRWNFDTVPLLGHIFNSFSPQDQMLFAQTSSKDLITMGRYILATTINLKLSIYRVIPTLLLDNNNRFKQTLYPRNLIGAIWMQLLQSFTGEKKYKQCSICHKWVDITNGNEKWTYHRSCGNTARSQKFRAKIKGLTDGE